MSSDDLAGLRHVREHAPPGLQIAAGEYGWNLPYFERMLAADAVDVLQADVTRCGGITNLIRLDGMCAARCLPLSAHCAPAVSAHACCALETIRHIEYFSTTPGSSRCCSPAGSTQPGASSRPISGGRGSGWR